jgi:hypothetical protein
VIDSKLIDVFPAEHDGYPDDLAKADTPSELFGSCGDAARSFPDSLWVEEKDRKALAEECERNKTFGVHFLDRYTAQGSSHECSAHAVIRSCEAAWNRQRSLIYADGPKKNERYEESKLGSVWLSPLSVYAAANPRQWGGSNIQHCLRIAQERGVLPDRTQPRDYGFRHAMQGSAGGREYADQSIGPWLPVSRFPEGWKETAKHFRPLEVIIIENWEQGLCCLLAGYVIAYGRRGHAVPVAHWDHKQNVFMYVDSYVRRLYDSFSTFKSACQGAVAVATMSMPDSWEKPAG